MGMTKVADFPYLTTYAGKRFMAPYHTSTVGHFLLEFLESLSFIAIGQTDMIHQFLCTTQNLNTRCLNINRLKKFLLSL